MYASNANDTCTKLNDLFLAAARRELEAEVLSKISIRRSQDGVIFEATGWGKKELRWCDVRLIVQSNATGDGLDGLCNDVVAAMVDGVEVIQ